MTLRKERQAEPRKALSLQLFHLLHHFPHFRKLLQDLIDFLNARPASLRDSFATTAIDNRDVGTLRRRHGTDNRLYMLDFFSVEVNIDTLKLFLDIAHTRQHSKDITKGSHLANLLKLFEKIV